VWRLLADREPVCVVSDLAGDDVGRSTWFTAATDVGRHPAELLRMFGGGATQTVVTGVRGTQALVASYWPTPRLVVVGDGTVAAALLAVAGLLGWQATSAGDAAYAGDPVASAAPLAQLRRSDAVVVLSHDLAVAGETLRSALAGAAGYVGGLGSRRTQQSRAGWLAEHGVPERAVRSIRGPAGLDLGARGPAEMAVSIVAEILAVQTGSTGQPLRDRPGPVHLDHAADRATDRADHSAGGSMG
jgi:xanthine dehydrogenase accessory factor